MNRTPMQRLALRYLRVTGEPDAALDAMLADCEAQLKAECRPRYLWRLYPITDTALGLRCGDTALCLSGADIRSHLRGCDRAVLLAATLSIGADTLLRRLSAADPAGAVVLDALASAWMEEICDSAEDEIRARLSPRFMTWRFSPGYGDLPLSVQKDFVRTLGAEKQIGLTVTEGDMLLPQKSVTAVIGLSDRAQSRSPHGCAVCNMKHTCGMRGACAGQTTSEE